MHEYQFVINGNDYDTKILEISEEEAVVEVNGTSYAVNISHLFKQKTPTLVRPKVVQSSVERTPLTDKPGKDHSVNTIRAPLPGVVLDIKVKVGDEVKAGQILLVMEAMKMENEIQAPRSGKIEEILVEKGASVLEGAPLLKLS
ncbi:MAG: biotin/lipoyl-containing protein [Vulcanimicrobiota bacterium]